MTASRKEDERTGRKGGGRQKRRLQNRQFGYRQDEQKIREQEELISSRQIRVKRRKTDT
jgi:hypothetical protein